MVEVVETQQSLTSATVLVDPDLLFVLQSHFGRHCEPAGLDENGDLRVRVAAASPLMIAQQLAGWGAGLQVVEPVAVQAELARIGAELLQHYGSAATTGS